MVQPYQDLINQLAQGSTGDWGYDPSLNATVNSLIGQASNAQSQYDQSRAQLESDYGAYTQQTQQDQAKALKALEDRMAYTGGITSGTYLSDQGDLGNQFQRMLQAAAQRRTRGLQGLDQSFSSFENQLLSTLGEARGGAASRYAQAQQSQALQQAQQDFQNRMLAMQQQGMDQQAAALRALMSGVGGGGGGGVVTPVPQGVVTPYNGPQPGATFWNTQLNIPQSGPGPNAVPIDPGIMELAQQLKVSYGDALNYRNYMSQSLGRQEPDYTPVGGQAYLPYGGGFYG